MPEDAAKSILYPKLRFLLWGALLYGGIWLAMDLPFMEYCFGAPFRPGMSFYRLFSGYVGGPIQYAANLFTQTYHRQWIGVLALTALALASWAVIRGVLRNFGRGSWNRAALAFSLLMLALAGRFVAVTYLLPVVAGTAAAWLYSAVRTAAGNPRGSTGPVYVRTQRSRWRERIFIVLFLFAAVFLHYGLASGFLYFSGLCALFELLIATRPLMALAWLAVGAATPVGVSYLFFEPDLWARYCRWIAMPEYEPLTSILLVAFYAYVPVAAIACFVAGRVERAPRFKPLTERSARIAGFGAVTLLAAGIFVLRLHRSEWVDADFLVASGRPEQALMILRDLPDNSDLVRFVTMHALAHTGRLPWEMFCYPQTHSSDALLLRDSKWDLFPRITDRRSDLYLDLGRVNEAERWAHEGLAVLGEMPGILERLAVTNILSGRPDAARIYLRALEQVPFQSARARGYLDRLERDPALGDDPQIRRIRPLMLRSDYVGNWSTEQIFLQSLQANPSNRMAFEYLLAHYLLNRDMKGFGQLAARFRDFYPVLPTHVEEALLVYRHVNGELPPGLENYSISSGLQERFGAFLDVLGRHPDDTQGCWNALSVEFGSTYWFFDFFGRTSAGARAKPSAQTSAPAASAPQDGNTP